MISSYVILQFLDLLLQGGDGFVLSGDLFPQVLGGCLHFLVSPINCSVLVSDGIPLPHLRVDEDVPGE